MAGDHKCPVCQATFTRPQHVARHMRSHTGDRPYKCSICGDQFARSDLLSRHVNKCHPSDKPHATSTSRRKTQSHAPRSSTSTVPIATSSQHDGSSCDVCVLTLMQCNGRHPCDKCLQSNVKCVYTVHPREPSTRARRDNFLYGNTITSLTDPEPSYRTFERNSALSLLDHRRRLGFDPPAYRGSPEGRSLTPGASDSGSVDSSSTDPNHPVYSTADLSMLGGSRHSFSHPMDTSFMTSMTQSGSMQPSFTWPQNSLADMSSASHNMDFSAFHSMESFAPQPSEPQYIHSELFDSGGLRHASNLGLSQSGLVDPMPAHNLGPMHEQFAYSAQHLQPQLSTTETLTMYGTVPMPVHPHPQALSDSFQSMFPQRQMQQGGEDTSMASHLSPQRRKESDLDLGKLSLDDIPPGIAAGQPYFYDATLNPTSDPTPMANPPAPPGLTRGDTDELWNAFLREPRFGDTPEKAHTRSLGDPVAQIHHGARTAPSSPASRAEAPERDNHSTGGETRRPELMLAMPIQSQEDLQSYKQAVLARKAPQLTLPPLTRGRPLTSEGTPRHSTPTGSTDPNGAHNQGGLSNHTLRGPFNTYPSLGARTPHYARGSLFETMLPPPPIASSSSARHLASSSFSSFARDSDMRPSYKRLSSNVLEPAVIKRAQHSRPETGDEAYARFENVPGGSGGGDHGPSQGGHARRMSAPTAAHEAGPGPLNAYRYLSPAVPGELPASRERF